VSKLLRKEVRIIDEETFEKGMKTADEISLALDDSTLFVIFLSDSALQSSWVRDELQDAKIRLDQKKIERIYPIIIDENIRFDDFRIPLWMRESLNIQQILRPAIAARKINARLLEISWTSHPRLKERKELFVGRNQVISTIEERLDNFDIQSPVALIASGLQSIGRKSVISHAVKKSNLVRDSYEFPFITLDSFDSIEDFIVKLDDLGLVAEKIPSLQKMSINEKVGIAKKIVDKIVEDRERILIEDHGVLVQRSGDIVDWFDELLEHLSPAGHLTFCIASQFKVKSILNRISPKLFSIHISELDIPERKGLLQRYARFQDINIDRSDLGFFSDLLTGFPEQVLFTVDFIKDEGLHQARRFSHTIQEYASNKAQVILERFKDRPLDLNFIYLLCRFEFISYEVLFDIVSEETYYPVLENLLSLSICERMGSTSDYIRVNEVVRDYVSRSRFGVPTEFEASIESHVNKFLSTYVDEHKDISDYLFSAQEALKSGRNLPAEIIIPSVLVKTIKRLYDEDRNYKDVILLAERILARERFMHANTVSHVRFIYCQSLARVKSVKFFDEVRKVSEPDRSFLQGFYYRLAGKYQQAEKHLLDANRKKRDPRTIGELVLVYMQSDEYEKAFELARGNYKNRSSNPINANSYFSCLIIKKRTAENRIELESIQRRLATDPSDRSQEMADSMMARIIAYYDEDEEKAMDLIDSAILRHQETVYPLLTKADLAVHFQNGDKLREAVSKLEIATGPNAQSFRTFIKFKAFLLAIDGKPQEAQDLIDKELSGMIPTALQRLKERILIASS
jgi:tetratricopeptide (TPR) repeat protein